MASTGKKMATVLRQHHYKLTRPRRAVLDVIAASREHLSPADIHARVRRESSHIGLVTVYRTLEILARLGLICEVYAGGDRRSYLMRRPAEHHHHLICSDCGRVVDFSHCDLGQLEQRLADETGFEIDKHLLEFTGRCRDCRETASVKP